MERPHRETLALELASALLTDAPQGDVLVGRVQQVTACSRDEAQGIVLEASAEVHAALFPPLTQLELVLTEGCNLGCTYCFEKEMLGYRRMPLEVAQRAVDLLILYSRGAPELDIAHFGGEPTLSFKTIQAVTAYAQNRTRASGQTVRFNMTTNGVLLNDEIAGYCAEQDIRVLLSIDGLQTAHDRYRRDKRGRGTFERVVQGLRVLQRYQPWIGIKMTVMPDNVGHLFDDVLGLRDMGVNQFTIGHATGVDWPEESMQAYAAALGRLSEWYATAKSDRLRIDELESADTGTAYFGCQAGRSSVSISVDGQVSPCSKVLALNNRHLLGKLGDVWCGLTHVKNRADLVGCAPLKAACEEQGIAADYRGGCFVSNFNETGSLHTPSLKEHRMVMMQRSACAGCGACGAT